MGQVIFTAETKEFRDQVAPEEPMGYCNIYQPQEGYRYYVIAGTAENTADFDISSSAFIVEVKTHNSREEGRLLFLDEYESDFVNSLESGQTQPCLIFMPVKDGDTPERLSVFYNKDYSQEEGTSFDCQVDITVYINDFGEKSAMTGQSAYYENGNSRLTGCQSRRIAAAAVRIPDIQIKRNCRNSSLAYLFRLSLVTGSEESFFPIPLWRPWRLRIRFACIWPASRRSR